MRRRSVRPAFCALVLCLCAGTVFAQSRYALVIGNAEYRNVDRLTNTVNDARDIAANLEKLGYQVDLKLNVTEAQFGTAVDNYVAKLSSNRNSEGFFWYAGHGIQIADQNYLLPVDITAGSERTVQHDAYSLNELLDAFAGAHNKVNVVILDACRNNPLSSSSRSAGSRGLAVVRDVPGDLFVMFSTAPGDVAQDGAGRNSPFAAAFLKHMASPQPVSLMAVDVTNETMSLTGQKQRPFTRGSIISEKLYALNPSGAPVSAPAVNAPSVNTPAPKQGFTIAGTKHWRGEIVYAEGDTEYIDSYDIVFVSGNTCIVTVTTEGGATQEAEGNWSFNGKLLRVNCTFRNPAIARIRGISWTDEPLLDADADSITLLVPAVLRSKKTVRMTLTREQD